MQVCKPNSVCPPKAERQPFLWAADCSLAQATYPGVSARLRGCTGETSSFSSLIWSCSWWGLSCPRHCCRGGELLPRRFTLVRFVADGLFSVTLSVPADFRLRAPRSSRGTLLCGVRTFLIPMKSPERGCPTCIVNVYVNYNQHSNIQTTKAVTQV